MNTETCAHTFRADSEFGTVLADVIFGQVQGTPASFGLGGSREFLPPFPGDALFHSGGSRRNLVSMEFDGNYTQSDPEDGFSSSCPFVPPPPSGPLRHSGESRNPEDTFPLGPGFRRSDEWGCRGDERAGGSRSPSSGFPLSWE